METRKLHERIRGQLADAESRFDVAAAKLKFGLHIFKPDSAKLETVVAVDIGLEASAAGPKSSLRSFYSPALYRYASAAKLEKDIRDYLGRETGLESLGS